MVIDFSKIKLVIWDLDETFWHGVLSDGTVEAIPKNIKLVNDMNDAGVVCSICSKNDSDKVGAALRNMNVAELFVFASVNWTPKGERVKQIVDEMNLRPVNVLFLDDNETNLAEVSEACGGIMTANVDLLKSLQSYYSDAEKKDVEHKRLKQYKVLEEKRNFKASIGSNEEFLKKCNIKVDIKKDCIDHLDRIHDLVQRSNQINFTKLRSSKDELLAEIKDEKTETGYVEVRDNFGEYGIVGFFAIKDNKLLHFVFSCRTLNMGVEQFVYWKLGKPAIEIKGEVSSSLNSPCPDWINTEVKSSAVDKKTADAGKIIIKGPCDMQQMFAFIKESKNIITEFVYVNNKGVSIEQGNHTEHIKQTKTLTDSIKNQLIKELPFGDKGMYETHIFDEDVSCVVYSLFTDPNLGMYRRKDNGAIVAFGEYTNDLTDESLWDDYCSQKLFTANCKFNKENLKYIKDNYEFLGRISPEETIENLDFIYKNLAEDSIMVLCLGSETAYECNAQAAYDDRHIYHKKLNDAVRVWAAGKSRICLLDVNKFLSSQSDFTNNINHFNKAVYYSLSEELIAIINSKNNACIEKATDEDKKLSELKRKIKKIPNKIARLINNI